MKRLTTLVTLLLGAVLLLSACDISVTPTPPPRTPEVTVNANTNPASSVATLNLQPNRDMLVQIDVSQAVRDAGPLIYVELNEDLNLQLQSAGRSPIAYSNSSAFFSRDPLGASSVGLSSQAVSIQTACRGSCVILQPGADSRYYALVRNNTGSAVSADLFAFADIYTDVYETVNNRPVSAPSITLGSSLSESGALETIGDEDYWQAGNSGSLLFTAPNDALEFRAMVTDFNGVARSQAYTSGSTIFLNAGEYLKVWSANNRAAASGSSVYYLGAP